MPPLDPETIALLIALLWPIIEKKLAKRSDAEVVEILAHPNRRQRFVVLVLLPKKERKELHAWWKFRQEAGEDFGMDEDLAVEFIEMGREESAIAKQQPVRQLGPQG